MAEIFSGRFDGIGGLTAVGHVVQADNTAAMTVDTAAADHSGWHLGTEAWLTIRPAVSQVLRRAADTIWDHAGTIWDHAVLWAAAAGGWLATERHDLWQAVSQKAIALIRWFSDHL